MNFKGKDLSVLGGFLFTADFLFMLLIDLVNMLSHYIAPDFLKVMAQMLDALSGISYYIFGVLILVCLFKKERFEFLQHFIDKFPKVSVYMYYIGFIGYIIFAVSVVVVLLINTGYFSELTINYMLEFLGIFGICGNITSLVLATYKVFFQPQTSEPPDK